MGAYASKSQCQAFHSVNLNCTVINATDYTPYRIIGGLQYGEFEPNPDVAGVGILYAFFSVACLALAVSALYLILQMTPFMRLTGIKIRAVKLKETMPTEGRNSYNAAWADTFETIILSCSDQQVFTSGAYALTLRYAQGCSISAYHYNIVANMMLITCATHLMSVTAISQYWKHKLLAVFRILLVTALYIVTVLLLSNQNAGLELQWPISLPIKNETDTLLVLPAACFQGDESTLDKTLTDTFGRGGNHLAVDAIGKSTPNNHIVGWNFFILMILWYGAAIIAEIFRLWYHRRGREEKNSRTGRKLLGRICEAGWIILLGSRRAQTAQNPENDPTTFGQLVPLLLILLTVFVALQQLGDIFGNFLEDKLRSPKPDPEGLDDNTVSQNLHSPSLPGKKETATTQVTSVPVTPMLELNDPMYQSTPPLPSTLPFTSPATSLKVASTNSTTNTTPIL